MKQKSTDQGGLSNAGSDTGADSRRGLLIMSLCPRCENYFRNSGYSLVKKGWQKHKEDCDFCNVGKGFTFEILGMDGGVK